MAERKWRTWWVVGALWLGACGLGCAQGSQADLASPSAFSSATPHVVQIPAARSGSLAGRLTDLNSAPLAGVSVLLRNRATGAEAHAVTARNGAFRVASLDAGEYTLEADEPHLGHGELEGILVTGGAEARVQAAMRFEPALVEATASSEIAAPSHPAAMPLTALAGPETSRQPGSGERPAVSRRELGVPHAATTDALTTEPLRPRSTAGLGTETVQAPKTAANPQPPAARARTMEGTTPIVPAAGPSVRTRTRLETQSERYDLALTAAAPRMFPLTQSSVAVLPVGARVANGLKGLLPFQKMVASPAAAAAQRLDPGTAATSTTITSAQLQSLPAGGRRWQEFLVDTPAASSSTESSQGSYRGSQEPAEITIDGANTSLKFGVTAGSDAGSTTVERANQGGDAQSAISQSMSQSWTGGRGFTVSEMAIHEVTASAGNVEAEGVRSAGGRTGIETERGGNALHGQEFYFDRQNSWGARNPFTQWVQNNGTAATPNFTAAPFTPPDHETVWGLGMGSRIRRDKLFWFGAIDSYRRNDPGLSLVKNPSEFFNLPEPTSADVTLLSAQLGESQSQAYNDYLGVSAGGYTAAGLEQLAGLLGPAARTASQWMGFGRVDWQAAERHHFTLEGIGADWNAAGGGLTRVSETYGNHSFGSNHATEQWLLARWEAYLTPNLLAVTQGSAGRAILAARPDTPSAFEQTFLKGNFWGQLPQIVVDSRYGFTIGNPARFGQGSYPDEKLYHAQEMLDWVHGRLLVKAGLEMDHNADATSLLRNQTGTYSYSTVASFISDALAFEKFGYADALDPRNPHNCGTSNTKFGSQPCYSYYAQTVGPTNWHLSTNDWAGYTTAQWQAAKYAVFSAGLRWELEQMPPPIATLANAQLPFTAKLPSLGNNWGPRVSVAFGNGKQWPVLRLGYGLYYGRTENATILTALTQTGSLRGDLNFFMRPSDDCQSCAGGSPPFPYVFAGSPASVVKPGAVGFAPTFGNPEVHQAVVSVEEKLPLGVALTTGAMLSLGRRLPVSMDTNINTNISSNANSGLITYAVKDPTGQGPIKATQIQVPFYASWPASPGTCPYYTPTSQILPGRPCPDYQQIAQIASRANSTYEAYMVKIVREGRRGLSLHAHYTYAHAMDWNPNGTTLVAGSDVLDPTNFHAEYGTSDLDVRHSAAMMAIFDTPWKMRGMAGRLGNGWMLAGIGQFRSGLPYTMRTSGSLPELFSAGGDAIVGLGPGMNGSGGDSRVYGFGNDGIAYNIGRNTFRYPDAWKADLRLGKRFNLGEMRQLEVLAESFNLFNHQNVTELETTGYAIESGASGTLPTLCYLTINTTGYASCGTTTISGSGTPLAAFGQPLNINATNFYRERQIQFGLRMRF